MFCILLRFTISAARFVSPLFLPHVGSSLVEVRFAELAEVMLACAGVTLGRRFGRQCLKFCKRPFVVLDLPWLAFRVGPGAAALLDSYPATWLWNPRNGRVPKQSWIACPPNDSDTLTTITLSAYDWVRKRAVTGASPSCASVGAAAGCNDSATSPSHHDCVEALWE